MNRQRFFLLTVSFLVLVGGISCNSGSNQVARSQAAATAGRGMEKYKYQCWEGGPHIVLPQSLKSTWKVHQLGINPLDPSTDYGRASAVSGDFGLISVGKGRALVLAQSPPLVAWSPMSSVDAIDLFILKSWSDENVDSLIDATIEKADLKQTGDSWQIDDDQLGLYYAGDDVQQPIAGEIVIPCRKGSYALWTYRFKGPERGEVVMIRLIRATEAVKPEEP